MNKMAPVEGAQSHKLFFFNFQIKIGDTKSN